MLIHWRLTIFLVCSWWRCLRKQSEKKVPLAYWWLTSSWTSSVPTQQLSVGHEPLLVAKSRVTLLTLDFIQNVGWVKRDLIVNLKRCNAFCDELRLLSRITFTSSWTSSVPTQQLSVGHEPLLVAKSRVYLAKKINLVSFCSWYLIFPFWTSQPSYCAIFGWFKLLTNGNFVANEFKIPVETYCPLVAAIVTIASDAIIPISSVPIWLPTTSRRSAITSLTSYISSYLPRYRLWTHSAWDLYLHDHRFDLRHWLWHTAVIPIAFKDLQPSILVRRSLFCPTQSVAGFQSANYHEPAHELAHAHASLLRAPDGRGGRCFTASLKVRQLFHKWKPGRASQTPKLLWGNLQNNGRLSEIAWLGAGDGGPENGIGFDLLHLFSNFGSQT